MAGVFDGPQIRDFIKDKRFESALNPVELSAWMSLKSVIANFEPACLLKCIFFIPVLILSTVGTTVKNKENVFTDISILEECYKGRWDVAGVEKGFTVYSHKRKALKSQFIPE